MMSVTYGYCRYAECCYAECHGACLSMTSMITLWQDMSTLSYQDKSQAKFSTIKEGMLVYAIQWGKFSCQFLLPGGSIGSDMFCKFYLVKNHKIANNSATTEAREKISTHLESLEFRIFDVWSTKFEDNQILLNKISDKF